MSYLLRFSILVLVFPLLPDSASLALAAQDEQLHYARGEVYFAGKWTPIEECYAIYRKAREELQSNVGKDQPMSKRISEITAELARVLDEWRKGKDPVDRSRADAVAKRSQAQYVLSLILRPPIMQQEPSQPIRAFYRSEYEFLAAVNAWALVVDRVRQENDRRNSEYQRQLAELQARKIEAAALLRAAESQIAECDRMLQALLAARKDREGPLFVERSQTTDTIRSLQAACGQASLRAKSAFEAIRAMPSAIRAKSKIIEWQNDFWRMADLEVLYEGLKKEIEAGRLEASQRESSVGRTLHKDWRHPRQSEMESLQEMISKVKLSP